MLRRFRRSVSRSSRMLNYNRLLNELDDSLQRRVEDSSGKDDSSIGTKTIRESVITEEIEDTTLLKVDVQLNEASPEDVQYFWMNALRPTFRKRRFGVWETQLQDDFVALRMYILDTRLNDYNLG